MVVLESGPAENGLLGSSTILAPADGGGDGNTSFGMEGLELEVDANSVEDGAATSRLAGENGFTFAATGSASRSCTVGLVRLIIEVGSAGFVLVRRGGVTGSEGRWLIVDETVAFFIASSSFLRAFHFLYLSAVNPSQNHSQIEEQQA